MVLYRGSRDKSALGDNGTSENLKMGPGVYMSDLEYVAKCYGEVRRISVESKDIVFMNKKDSVSKLIGIMCKYVEDKFKVNIPRYIPRKQLDEIVESVVTGYACIIGLPEELCLWLDSSEAYYGKETQDVAELQHFMDSIIVDFMKKKVIAYNDTDIDGLVYFTTGNDLLTVLEKESVLKTPDKNTYCIFDEFGNRKDITKEQAVEMLAKAKDIISVKIDNDYVTKKIYKKDSNAGKLVAVKMRGRWYKVVK